MHPWLDRLVGLALPPRCPGCNAVVLAPHQFCAGCWQSLRLLGPPWCPACHLPQPYDSGGIACDACAADPPRHAGIDAAVAYGPVARTLALRLKYAGRAAFAETAARLMRRHLAADAELLVPVPLHRWRLWWRGYNQAALIAAALSRASGVESDVRLLERSRATPSLRGLGRSGRRRAVRDAFIVPDAARTRLAGRRVVLIDDVHTTGATADACTAALLAAGAAQVRVLCWARVLPGNAAD